MLANQLSAVLVYGPHIHCTLYRNLHLKIRVKSAHFRLI